MSAALIVAPDHWSSWMQAGCDPASAPGPLIYSELPQGVRNRIEHEHAIARHDRDELPQWIQAVQGVPKTREDRVAAGRRAREKEIQTRLDDIEYRRQLARENALGRRAQEKADAAGIRPVRAMAMTAAQMMSAEPPPALIQDVLDGGGMSMLIGTRGTGKSFIALDMALSVALGRPWGHYPTTPAKGRVLYVVGEGGGRAFGVRIEAWCRQRGVDPAALDRRFLAIDGAVPFMSSRWDELVALAAEFDPDHTVIDTLSRHAVGLEENSNSDAATAVAKAEALRDRTGCSVMVLHHPPKATVGGGVNAGRGAGAWEAGIDTVLTLTDNDGVLEIFSTKQKHRLDGVVIGHWRLETVPVTPNGTWASSAVPVPVDPFSSAPDVALDGAMTMVLTYLAECKAADMLPNMRTFEQEFAENRNGARKALRALIADGRVTQIKGVRGAKLLDLAPSSESSVPPVCHPSVPVFGVVPAQSETNG